MFSFWSRKAFGLNIVTINIEITVSYGKHRNKFILFPENPILLSLLKKAGWILLLGFCTQAGGIKWNWRFTSKAQLNHSHWDKTTLHKPNPSLHEAPNIVLAMRYFLSFENIMKYFLFPMSPWPWGIFISFFLLQMEIFGAGQWDFPPAQCLPCPCVHQVPQKWWLKDLSGCRILPPAGSSLIKNNLHAERQYDSYSKGFV